MADAGMDPRPNLNDPGPSEEFEGGEHPLKRVPNYEQLSTPEALAPANMNDAQSIIPVFGEYLVRCIYSRTWNLREAALIKMDLDLNAGKWDGQDERNLLQAFNQVLKIVSKDKIPQVFLQSQHLLLSLSQVIFTHLKKAKKNVPSRVVVARLTILRQLATDYGWQPGRKDGVPSSRRWVLRCSGSRIRVGTCGMHVS